MKTGKLSIVVVAILVICELGFTQEPEEIKEGNTLLMPVFQPQWEETKKLLQSMRSDKYNDIATLSDLPQQLPSLIPKKYIDAYNSYKQDIKETIKDEAVNQSSQSSLKNTVNAVIDSGPRETSRTTIMLNSGCDSCEIDWSASEYLGNTLTTMSPRLIVEYQPFEVIESPSSSVFTGPFIYTSTPEDSPEPAWITILPETSPKDSISDDKKISQEEEDNIVQPEGDVDRKHLPSDFDIGDIDLSELSEALKRDVPDVDIDKILENINYEGIFGDSNQPRMESRGIGKGRNIIATLPGTKHPEKRLIFTAHYDILGGVGADDNSSGVTALLEAISILSLYKFDYTLQFVFFDGEEEGFWGSDYFRTQMEELDANAQENILGVINVDMVGDLLLKSEIGSEETEDLDIGYHNNPEAEALANDIGEIIDFYTPSLSTNISMIEDDLSDDWEFRKYPSLLFIEDLPPQIWESLDIVHTPNDTPDKIDFAFLNDVTKTVIAVAAEVGGIHIIPSYLRVSREDRLFFRSSY